jgi:hypothetical protein
MWLLEGGIRSILDPDHHRAKNDSTQREFENASQQLAEVVTAPEHRGRIESSMRKWSWRNAGKNSGMRGSKTATVSGNFIVADIIA